MRATWAASAGPPDALSRPAPAHHLLPRMMASWELPFAALSAVGLVLLGWQWWVGLRYRPPPLVPRAGPWPGLTVLKPLQGRDPSLAECLASWLDQEYPGPLEFLFGVGSAEDPAGPVVRELLATRPDRAAKLVVCDPPRGTNPKVSKLVVLAERAQHGFLVVSDADVLAPPGLLRDIASRVQAPGTGLVHYFYRLGNPTTAAMRCEAVAMNIDFWSQVLQARSLGPVDFALGAALALHRDTLEEIGGFESWVHHVADDFQMGHRVARAGWRVELGGLVVDCLEPVRGWRAAWRHQLRWGRTIRACRPVAYGLSILSNALLWALVWWGAAAALGAPSLRPASAGLALCLGARILTGLQLQRRMVPEARARAPFWMIPVKDLLGVAIWAMAMLGGRVEWRGEDFRVRRGGRMERLA